MAFCINSYSTFFKHAKTTLALKFRISCIGLELSDTILLNRFITSHVFRFSDSLASRTARLTFSFEASTKVFILKNEPLSWNNRFWSFQWNPDKTNKSKRHMSFDSTRFPYFSLSKTNGSIYSMKVLKDYFKSIKGYLVPKIIRFSLWNSFIKYQNVQHVIFPTIRHFWHQNNPLNSSQECVFWWLFCVWSNFVKSFLVLFGHSYVE